MEHGSSTIAAPTLREKARLSANGARTMLLDVKQWCKRLSNNETQGGGYVYKFSFEHTPNKAATM